MGEITNFSELYNSRNASRVLTDDYRKQELKASRPLFDSPLSGGKNSYSFNESFFSTLPEGIWNSINGLQEYIEGLLMERKGEAIGIEFGGPGCKLFQGFTKDLFKKTAGVTLVDKFAGERLSNHTVIEGEILKKKAYSDILKWSNGQQIDLIIERMDGALGLLPNIPTFVYRAFQRWYDLLSEGGVMFVQIPREVNEGLTQLHSYIESECPETIKIKFGGSALRLNKLAGAPMNLPNLL